MNKLRKAMIGAALCALPLMANGQDIHWQARGGIGCSSVFAGVTNIKDRVGFHVGGGADIGLSKNGVWRFQPSLQFVRKGWKFDGFYGNEQIMEARYSTRLDYLQLPLQMAARLRLGKDCFLTFRSGGYVAISAIPSISTHAPTTRRAARCAIRRSTVGMPVRTAAWT